MASSEPPRMEMRSMGEASEPSQDGFRIEGGYRTFHGYFAIPLGFSRDGDYMGEEAESGAPWWATQARARVGPHLGGVCPPRCPPSGVLLAQSSLRDFKVLAICPM